MWVSELEFNNIRSFAASGAIKLSKNINILLGANNAGKSTIIRVLYLLRCHTEFWLIRIFRAQF
jgi:recombinational DNA repair ATPase RecF